MGMRHWLWVVSAATALVWQAAPAAEAEIDPVWVAPSALSGPAREFARREAKRLEDEMGLDDSQLAHFRRRTRAALVPLPQGGDLLLIQTVSLGNCGSINVSVFAPADNKRMRKPLMDSTCLHDIRFRPHPDRQFPDLVSSASNLLDFVTPWDGQAWKKAELHETSKPQSARKPLAGTVRPERLNILKDSYELGEVISRPWVGETLRRGFGDRYLKYLFNLTVRSPWQQSGRCWTLNGLAPHSGGEEEGVLTLCPDGSVHAAMLSGGKERTLLSPAGSFAALPENVRDFLGPDGKPGSPNFTWLP